MTGPAAVGLFGTRGTSRWRVPFLSYFERTGIPYYNPQIPPGEWTPAAATVEAEHLHTCRYLVFAITDESPGWGSLAEVGFAVASVASTDRDLIAYIAPQVSPLVLDEVGAAAAFASDDLRGLVRAHLTRVTADPASGNVHVVDSLYDLYTRTLGLYVPNGPVRKGTR